MFRRILNIIFFISCGLLYSQESWNTNILDYSWNKISRKMIYREPITFTPFEIKVGYFHYGGADYLNDFQLLGGDLGIHPVQLDSVHSSYNGLNSLKDRNGVFMEIDVAKTNILFHLVPQNVIDVQFGLGYRFSHMLSRPSLPDNINYIPQSEDWHNYKFIPKIHDFNLNTTLNWQISEKIIPYIYHSIGFSKISLYRTDADHTYLTGDAISETFSIGVKRIMKNNFNRKYDLYYGAELKTTQTTSLDLYDPEDFSPIIGFDMRSINFNITFGVSFGGKRTIGDEAFSMLLENDYSSAIPAFEEYIEDYPKHGKLKKANKMLQFCKEQIPHKIFNQGLEYINNNKIDEGLILLNEAYINADDDLKFEINFKKEAIAKKLIEEIYTNFDNLSIKTCENMLNNAYNSSPDVHTDVYKIKGNLFFKKASMLHEENLLTDAIKYYNLAKSYNNDLTTIINKRLDSLVADLLKKSEGYKDRNEYALVIESLKKAIELNPELSFRLEPTIKEFELLIIQYNKQKTQRFIDKIINENKSRSNQKIEINIGMTKDKVIDILGMPDDINFIKSSFDSYEIWSFDESNRKLYIKNEKLYHIQNTKE